MEVKKCFTDQNMLKTVKTKSVAVLSLCSPFLLFAASELQRRLGEAATILSINAKILQRVQGVGTKLIRASFTRLLSPGFRVGKRRTAYGCQCVRGSGLSRACVRASDLSGPVSDGSRRQCPAAEKSGNDSSGSELIYTSQDCRHSSFLPATPIHTCRPSDPHRGPTAATCTNAHTHIAAGLSS